MSIISIQRDQNNNISIVRMQVSDALATVSMTDYILDNQDEINALNGGVWQWFITDMILVAAEDGNAFYEFVDTNFETIVIFGQKGTGTINPGLENNLPYYAANGNTLSPLSNANNSILATGNTGVPALTTTLPSAVQTNITQLGTIGMGVWNGTPIAVSFGGTGNTTFTPYSVVCAGTTSTGALQNVSGLGTSGYILTSQGASALPIWAANAASGTVNPGTANDLAYYQSTGSAVSALSSSASSVLVTSGMAVPGWSTTLPAGLTIPGYQTSLTFPLTLTQGGTNASLTASNGGIIYSTASAMAVLAGTATAGQLLLSGSSTAPSWSTATFSSTYAVNTILYAGSSNTVSGLSTANSSVLATSAGGVPAWTQSLPIAVQVGVNSLNSGTGASSSTFWRGDGTWAAITGTGTVNSGTTGQVAYYASSSAAVSGGTLSNILGVTDGSSSSSGHIGEFISSSVTAASPVSYTTGSPANITSISITAGDWDIFANFNSSSTTSFGEGWVSATSASLPDASLTTVIQGNINQNGGPVPYQRFSVTMTTTVYLSYNGGTSCNLSGNISARRVR